MKLLKKSTVSLVFGISSIFLSFANADERQHHIGVLGGIGLSSPSIKVNGNEPDKSSKIGFTGGLSYEYTIHPLFGVEVDALYERRAFKTTSAGTETSFGSNHLTIPVLLRVHPISYFSVGVGGYYSSSFGDLSTETGSNSTSIAYTSAGVNRPDAGLIASLRGQYPIADQIQAVLDVRGLLGLVNQNSIQDDNNSFKTRGIQAMLGVTYSL
jgi:hypothetical protein